MSDLEKQIQQWREAGFSGLYCEDEPCGCTLDDVAPCGESPFDCVPGYKHDDPRPGAPLGWVISAYPEKLSPELWERMTREYI